MGQYIFDLLKITARSEIRASASDVASSTHVLDMVPQGFQWGQNRLPYIPAEQLHGIHRNGLDRIYGHSEVSWQTAEATKHLFGYMDKNGQRRGRLRFSHALPLKMDRDVPVSLYTRNKIHPLLGTVKSEALIDELFIQEGYEWLFIRLLRAPDLADGEIQQHLHRLDLVQKGFRNRFLTFGAGKACGHGIADIELLTRIRLGSDGRILSDGDDQALNPEEKLPQWVPAFFHIRPERQERSLVDIPDLQGQPNVPSLCLLELTNLGQLTSGRELIPGTQIFGALAALALELDNTVPLVRVQSQEPTLVDIDHLFGQKTGVVRAQQNGYFTRLYRAWKESQFRISPFIPKPEEYREGLNPLLYYNTCAQRAYQNARGYYYDNQMMHIHHRKNRDTGTAAEGSMRTTVEIKPCQSFVGFIRMGNEDVRRLFTSLMRLFPAADLGLCKHSLVRMNCLAYGPLAPQSPTGNPHLITPALDEYVTHVPSQEEKCMLRYWTGLFPCSSSKPVLGRRIRDCQGMNRVISEYDIREGWAVPIEAAQEDSDRPARQGKNCFAVRGTPCHENINPPDPLQALLNGIGALPEWRCLGFGQVVYL